MSTYAIDLAGRRFGRLVVLARAANYVQPNGAQQPMWACRCDCGNEAEIRGRILRDGKGRSCGCLAREASSTRARTHGLGGKNKPAEYHVWQAMKQRCLSRTAPAYKDYGGRGIRVCDAWLRFENFIADMGPRPSAEHSIDRIDNDGNYEPGNCRWATAYQQTHNRRPRKRAAA